MKIKLRDDFVEFESGITLMDIAKSISQGLARNALVAKVNGKLTDLSAKIYEDTEVEFLSFQDDEGKKAYRHSSSHILAQAVKHLYPDVKDAIGPAIENGFYYDFDFITPLDRENGLAMIEEEMKKIIKADYPFVRKEVSKQEAMEMMKNEPYKLELIENLPSDATITLYSQGDFVDLCSGPHVPSTGYIKAIKLTSATGAYWRGDEKNKMLTRIYGTSFDKKSNLDAYLQAVEEAKKRDHNKLGREMEIFMTDENIGQGLPLLMPKGAKLMQILQRFVEDEEARRGYVLTKTPYMAKRELYQLSGHWEHYKDGMFLIGDPDGKGEVLALRPMTCPFQYSIYNNGLKSYKDLPIRYAETSTLFRNESSGEMHGLIRVRQFTISEGHLICMPSQLEKEFKGCLDLAMYMLKCLGLLEDVSFRFSRWDAENTEKYINEPEQWNYVESEMKRILDSAGIKYQESIGEAAFYGPKLDIQIKNVFGKEDTLITLQIDMFLAERFDMTYVDENNTKSHPYIIHRTSLGCYERTIALLVEKYAGAFPLWMAPTQVKVISLTDRTAETVKDIAGKLNSAGIRAEYDSRNESMKYKVRDFQLKKIPYALIVGDREVEQNVVAVRDRKEGMVGTMSLNDFIVKLQKEIKQQISY